MTIDLEKLPTDTAELQEMIRGLAETVVEVTRDRDCVRARLDELLRKRFGRSAEKIDAAQLRLFAQEFIPDLAEQVEAGDAPPSKPRPRRSKHGRGKFPDHLDRVTREYDIAEEDRECPECGTERLPIGDESSEQLDYVPAQVFVIVHRRKKYACPECLGEVITADKPVQAIEKCAAAPGLVAHIAVSKYSDHLPLHRQEKILKRNGIHVSRSTTCDWMRQCADALVPLYTLMQTRVVTSSWLHTDDTPVDVQDRAHAKNMKQGRFWVYSGDDEHPYDVFDYTPDRSRTGPKTFLEKFKGYLHADAYAGYKELYEKGAIVEVACWAHARRKFYDARLSAVGPAHQALAMIKQMYVIERKVKEGTPDADGNARKLTADEIRTVRQEEAVPLLDRFKTWADEQAISALPKSPIGDALQYVLRRWASFTRYTTDGRLAIDNNVAERALRSVAIGRKNWMFCGSDRGGRTAAILFSMIASCNRHGVDPYAWLRDALDQIATIRLSELELLLPDRWADARPLPAASTASA